MIIRSNISQKNDIVGTHLFPISQSKSDIMGTHQKCLDEDRVEC